MEAMTHGGATAGEEEQVSREYLTFRYGSYPAILGAAAYVSHPG